MTFFGMTLYQIGWYFLIYSVLGWVIEVVFHAVTLGKVINRGFLNGPVCPVYGFGVLSVFAMSGVMAKDAGGVVEAMPVWQLFLGGVILATLIELIAGFLLDKLFHARWWDYSDRPLNFHGYICLEFSLIWGLGIAFVVRDLQPTVRSLSAAAVPERIGWPILGIAYALYVADLVVTVLTVLRMNRRLEELDKVRASMRVVSDGMSRVIGGGTVRTVQEIERGKERAQQAGAEAKAALADAGENLRESVREAKESLETSAEEARQGLQERREGIAKNAARQRQEVNRRQEELYYALQKEKYFGTGRLLRAFPKARHSRFGETMAWVQQKLREEGGVE